MFVFCWLPINSICPGAARNIKGGGTIFFIELSYRTGTATKKVSVRPINLLKIEGFYSIVAPQSDRNCCCALIVMCPARLELLLCTD